jgi:hypothetical protein
MATEKETEEILVKMRGAVKNTQFVAESLNCLDVGLRLDETIEGGDYWREIIRRLRNYVDAVRGDPISFPDVISHSKPAKVIGEYVASNLNGPIHVYHFGGGMCATEGLKGKAPLRMARGTFKSWYTRLG